MTLARQLYSLFFESSIAHAVGTVTNGKVNYYTVEAIPTLDLIEQHLAGETVLGAYTVLPGNEVTWCAWDIDCAKDSERARELTKKLSDFLSEIPHAVEYSGGKGYHVEVFFSRRYSAKAVKQVGESIRDVLGLPKRGDCHVEFFPKQSELTEQNPFGNLLRLPLGVHPKTRKSAVFVNTTDWENGKSLDAEKILSQRTNLESLQALVEEQEPLGQLVNLLAPYWETGQRHDISLYLAGYLAFSGWTEEGVIQLLSEIHADSPEGDLQDQLKTVTSTFKKHYEGEKIIGFSGLADILPSSTLKQLTELAGKQVFSVTLQVIDRIRLAKGVVFLKVRNSAQTAVTHFKEKGRLVRDINHTYWFDSVNHKLVKVDGPSWERLLHSQFGLNLSESFGRQVAESIGHYSYDAAKEVTVYKRSYWSGKELFLNLGGPEVYILNGKPEERRVIFNGESDILFLNEEDRMCLPNLEELDIAPISPWSFLVDDLNFLTGVNINTSSLQQRELFKAWIASIFFAQTLPTRPILTLLAAAGSGKTTAARRVLRFLEGVNEDVLGVVQDKPDSLRSSLMAHKVLVLDNIEKTKATWLTDILNRASTGLNMELRVLHTTNKVQVFKPDVYVIITATEMPFSEETVYTRMLPIELAPLTFPRPEHQMQMQLVENFNALWKGLLNDLDKVVAELKRVQTFDTPSESRLADFTVFCSRIRGCDFLDGKELMNGLGSLVSRQRQVLENSSPFTEVLEIWLRSRGEGVDKWFNISELFALLQRIANANRIDWRWTHSQGLSRHVNMLEPQLIKHFGMITRKTIENSREVKQYKFEKKHLVM